MTRERIMRLVGDARPPSAKHQKALERRIAYLRQRVDAAADEPLSFDLQELEALRATVVLIDFYVRARAGDIDPMSVLLSDAADLIDKLNDNPSGAAELATELRRRSLLLRGVG